MSTVKVNKITPRTCNSIQLGESGDTLTIPSGATLQNCGTATGFGISFCSTVKTSPFTATAGKGFFINTGSAVTVTLPASPSTGDELIVIDSTGNASSNNITLGRNGSKIKGQCIDAKINVDRGGVRIVYSGSSQGWVTATAANDATASQIQYVTATGGTVTTCGDFKIHTFTSSSNFVVSCGGNSCGSNTVDYLVVGGGGAGGANIGGGGGAGGFRESSGAASGCYSKSPLGACVSALPVPAQTYPITVGGGGTATPGPGPQPAGGSGTNSIFSSITSAGGGGGGNPQNASATAGGSGGGGRSVDPASSNPVAGGAGNTPPVSPPQGNNGGTGVASARPGGGGGATTVGGNGGPPSCSGDGGAGATTSITASPVAYAGGGGGGGFTCYSTAGTGGTGGGGNGGQGPASPAGSNGTANTGGGSGGGGSSSGVAGTGGSGIVVIRYKFQN